METKMFGDMPPFGFNLLKITPYFSVLVIPLMLVSGAPASGIVFTDRQIGRGTSDQEFLVDRVWTNAHFQTIVIQLPHG
jgi:hypothetical protein